MGGADSALYYFTGIGKRPFTLCSALFGGTPRRGRLTCCALPLPAGHMADRDKSRCYFKGTALDVRPDFDQLDPSVCLAGCFCRQTKEANAV